MFNYSKPGPGVDKDGPQKKRFFYFFELFGRKFWKLIELNLLYLVCCIPIVTIGPATCGLVYILQGVFYFLFCLLLNVVYKMLNSGQSLRYLFNRGCIGAAYIAFATFSKGCTWNQSDMFLKQQLFSEFLRGETSGCYIREYVKGSLRLKAFEPDFLQPVINKAASLIIF